MKTVPSFILGGSIPIVKFDDGFYPQVEVTAEAIERMAKKYRNFKQPLNESLRMIIIPSIKANFAAEGRPKWLPLAAATVRRRGSAHPILDRKGKLRRKASQINIWSVERDQMYVSGLDVRVFYAKFHQGGTFIMPARPFMVFHGMDIRGIERIFKNWMGRIARESGFK